ncbi:hypothetical protein INT47_000065 [Mucor saturninus]|uniref:Uncharacterized protein n=1 Tax=Mucor saturninus TaxID=64648 RepID=A0A8H7RGW2_9FUNG|nr:hypothetical protein INT47_000065 [Mucor saturninus]
MENDSGYSQSYFITICFNEDRVYTDYFFNGFKKEVNPYLKQARRISILFNTVNQKVLAQGDEADKRKWEEIDQDIVYVDNIFSELNDERDKSDKLDEHGGSRERETIILNAVKGFLTDTLYKFPPELGTKFPPAPEEITKQSGLFHRFAFFLPPHWDSEVREFIQSVFLDAKLIENDDSRRQLVFFSQLETIFRYLQSPRLMEHEIMHLRIEYGRQYTIAGLKIMNDTLHVSFNLFSAQYPPLDQPDVNCYVARPLDCTDFTIPFKGHLKKGLFFPADIENLSTTKWKEILCSTPFKRGHISEGLTSEEVKRLESITMAEIHENLFDFISRTSESSRETSKQSFDSENIRPIMLVIHGIQTTSGERPEIRSYMNDRPKYKHKIVKFGSQDLLAVEMPWRNILIGNSMQVKNEIKVTMANRLKLSESGDEVDSALTLPDLKNPNPSYFVNIDTLIRETSDGYIKCGLQPLSRFFDQLVTYQSPVLRVTDSDEDHGRSLDNEEKRMRDLLQERISTCFSKENFELEIPQKSLAYIHDIEYVELFVVMYMGYLNGLVRKQLDKQFGVDRKDKTIAYVISAEKKLLDNSIILYDNSSKLLYQCGILGKKDGRRKARIVAQEEEIISVLQDKLQVSFRLQEYFIVVQLHENFLHITLHKAIQSHDTSLAAITAIVVQDEIIPIENSNNELCENIWSYVNSNGNICNCPTKIAMRDEELMLLLFDNYNTFMHNLRKKLSEIFASTDTGLNMDKGIDIAIRLKPVIQDITTVIAAAIANTDLLGNYEITSVFILGSIFNPSIKSPLKIVHKQMLQDELSASIELNGKDTPGYVMNETLCELLQPMKGKKPFMYDSFRYGNINQTSSETYAVYIDDFYENPSSGKASRPFLSCIKYNTDGASIVRDSDAAMIVLQKGQPIPVGGLIIQFKMGLGSMEKKLDTIYVLKIALVRLMDSENTTQGEIVSLDRNRYDNLCIFSLVRNKKAFGYPIHFETKYKSHNSTLQFSLRMTGDGNDYESNTKCTSVAQQSRVAYT